MPLRDYLCDSCGYEFSELVTSKNPDEYRHTACRCGAKAEVLPALIGGYQGNLGGSSTRPKNSTAMPRAKAFTGNKESKE